VDLDGARNGIRANAPIVRDIADAIGVPIQVGGGIRDVAAARELLEQCVDRVVFGTAALEAPEEVKAAVEEFGADRVIVSVDARDGKVSRRGWLESSEITAIELMKRMSDRGVQRFMYTDIARDGTLDHPNLEALADILESTEHPLIAAGGIATVQDLLALAALGVEAAVIGQAIYGGAIDLAEVIGRVSEKY
jgi:phosphoribosylformimino-5-aminoimidazole carboxamide ribotide isomerase